MPTLPPCAPQSWLRASTFHQIQSSQLRHKAGPIISSKNVETGSERPSNLCRLTQQESGKAGIIGPFFWLESLFHFHYALKSGWFVSNLTRIKESGCQTCNLCRESGSCHLPPQGAPRPQPVLPHLLQRRGKAEAGLRGSPVEPREARIERGAEMQPRGPQASRAAVPGPYSLQSVGSREPRHQAASRLTTPALSSSPILPLSHLSAFLSAGAFKLAGAQSCSEAPRQQLWLIRGHR